MKKNQITIIRWVVALLYILFVGLSFTMDIEPGKRVGWKFIEFLIYILKIMPFAFIAMGLFEVWVKQETVERHLGEESGIKGHFYAILLASMMLGGLLLAFPLAYVLYQKNAKLSVIFTFLGSAAVCRVPMTILEASFVGIGFSLVRWMVSLPLIVISSIIMGNYLSKHNYEIKQ